MQGSIIGSLTFHFIQTFSFHLIALQNGNLLTGAQIWKALNHCTEIFSNHSHFIQIFLIKSHHHQHLHRQLSDKLHLHHTVLLPHAQGWKHNFQEWVVPKPNLKLFNPIPDSRQWILSKDVVLAAQYKVYLVKQVISLVDTVQYS